MYAHWKSQVIVQYCAVTSTCLICVVFFEDLKYKKISTKPGLSLKKSVCYESDNTHDSLFIPWHFIHDDVIKWKHFPRCRPFVQGPVNSPHKGQWRRALMFSLICAWINDWANNPEPGDLRRLRTHYDATLMFSLFPLIAVASFLHV